MKILNKMNLSKKINVLIIIYTVIVILSYTTLSLNTSGKKAMETAGVELAGCASITSGTIDEKDVEAIIKQDQNGMKTVEKDLFL